MLEESSSNSTGSNLNVLAISGNIISGNGLSGITTQQDSQASSPSHFVNTIISDNIIGLDVNGATAGVYVKGAVLPLGNVLDGVLIDNAVGVTVGSPNVLAKGKIVTFNGNVISGNLGRGIEVRGDQLSNVGANLVQGNIIGLDYTGTDAVAQPNNNTASNPTEYTLGNLSDGIFLFVPGTTTIGGTSAGSGNVISNNRAAGIHAATQANGGAATGTLTINGNFVGTDITGTSTTQTTTTPQGSSTVPLGNGSDGIFIDSINTGVTIGGVTTASSPFSNVISGNRADGIDLLNSAYVLIAGNFVGVNANGTSKFGDPLLDFGNASNGIFVNESNHITIGGSVAGTGNVISSNHASGIFVSGTNSVLPGSDLSANYNEIAGNEIGVNGAGTQIVQNANVGIVLSNSSFNTIGATSSGSIVGGPAASVSAAQHHLRKSFGWDFAR